MREGSFSRHTVAPLTMLPSAATTRPRMDLGFVAGAMVRTWTSKVSAGALSSTWRQSLAVPASLRM